MSSRRSHRRQPARRGRLLPTSGLRGRKFLVEPLEPRTPPSDTFAGLIGIAGAAGAFDPWVGSSYEPLTAALQPPQWSLGTSMAAEYEIVSPAKLPELPHVPIFPSLDTTVATAAPRPATGPELGTETMDHLLAGRFEPSLRLEPAQPLPASVEAGLAPVLAQFAVASASAAGDSSAAGMAAVHTPAGSTAFDAAAPIRTADSNTSSAPPARPHGQIEQVTFPSASQTIDPARVPVRPPGGGMTTMSGGGPGEHAPEVSGGYDDVYHCLEDEEDFPDDFSQFFSDEDVPEYDSLTYSAETSNEDVVTCDMNGSTGVMTLDFGSVGLATVTVTATDEAEQSAELEFDVYVVQVTGFTLEWQQPNGSWAEVGANEVAWSHDTLRWTASWVPSSAEPDDVQFLLISWEDRAEPLEAWDSYSAGGTGSTEFNPGADDYAVVPYLDFSSGGSAWLATPERRIIAEITGIEWTTHTDPDYAGDLDSGGSGLRFFPDAESPGGSARPKVDVLIQVEPGLPGIFVYTDVYDVDDWTDSDGPIDDDPSPLDTDVNNADNFSTPGVGLQYILSSPGYTDENGQIRAVFEIGAIQPGNNWRIAAAGRQEELYPVKPMSLTSLLFYDDDGDGFFEWNDGEVALDEGTFEHGIRVTQRLTLWRRLHVEVDSMGNVAYNTDVRRNLLVQDNGDGTSTVYVSGQWDSEKLNRFDGGELEDSTGNVFEIISNGMTGDAAWVKVYNHQDGTTPSGQSHWVSLVDDDHLRESEGDNVPMPDCTELEEAMAEAFVEVLYDVGDSNDNVTFTPNTDTSVNNTSTYDWDSKDDNSPAYWVTYVLGAFQGKPNEDNDPVTESWLVGVSFPQGVSLIFLETAVDVAREEQWPADDFERDIVVHEVGHAVAKSGEHPVTQWPNVPSRYVEEYLKEIRSTDKPKSP